MLTLPPRGVPDDPADSLRFLSGLGALPRAGKYVVGIHASLAPPVLSDAIEVAPEAVIQREFRVTMPPDPVFYGFQVDKPVEQIPGRAGPRYPVDLERETRVADVTFASPPTPMRASLPVALGAVGVLAGAVALEFGVLGTALSGTCGNTVVARVPSPDGRLDAVVFQRDCGATTGFSTHVSIVRAGHALPEEGGNLVVAEGGPTGPGGGPVLRAAWAGARQLRVRHDVQTRIVHIEPPALGVQAALETLGAP